MKWNNNVLIKLYERRSRTVTTVADGSYLQSAEEWAHVLIGMNPDSGMGMTHGFLLTPQTVAGANERFKGISEDMFEELLVAALKTQRKPGFELMDHVKAVIVGYASNGGSVISAHTLRYVMEVLSKAFELVPGEAEDALRQMFQAGPQERPTAAELAEAEREAEKAAAELLAAEDSMALDTKKQGPRPKKKKHSSRLRPKGGEAAKESAAAACTEYGASFEASPQESAAAACTEYGTSPQGTTMLGLAFGFAGPLNLASRGVGTSESLEDETVITPGVSTSPTDFEEPIPLGRPPVTAVDVACQSRVRTKDKRIDCRPDTKSQGVNTVLEGVDCDLAPPVGPAPVVLRPGYECVICISQDACMLVQPCMHLCMCMECAAHRPTTCPMCRYPARSIDRVYFP